MRAGANGYVCKQDNPDRLVEAIRTVRHGGTFISPELAARLREYRFSAKQDKPDDPTSYLSERELEIFSLIGNGYSTNEIAHRLHLSPKTVSTHRDHLKKKIGVEDNARLVHRATEWVLTST
jgi:DNA-binding NarL/FixJ family response regulator